MHIHSLFFANIFFTWIICVEIFYTQTHTMPQEVTALSKRKGFVWYSDPLIYDMEQREWKLLTSINIFFKHVRKGAGSWLFFKGCVRLGSDYWWQMSFLTSQIDMQFHSDLVCCHRYEASHLTRDQYSSVPSTQSVINRNIKRVSRYTASVTLSNEVCANKHGYNDRQQATRHILLMRVHLHYRGFGINPFHGTFSVLILHTYFLLPLSWNARRQNTFLTVWFRINTVVMFPFILVMLDKDAFFSDSHIQTWFIPANMQVFWRTIRRLLCFTICKTRPAQVKYLLHNDQLGKLVPKIACTWCLALTLLWKMLIQFESYNFGFQLLKGLIMLFWVFHILLY